MKSALALATCSCLWATVGHATTLLVTESAGHNRALVAGSTDLDDSKSSVNLNTLVGGLLTAQDHLGIYGRIVSSADRFTFSTASKFNLVFDFDGYDLANGGAVEAGLSGLIDQSIVTEAGDANEKDGDGKGVVFSLFNADTLVGQQSYLTNITSATSHDDLIFGGIDPGTYTLTVDGSVGPFQSRAALYDIELAPVPLPLTGVLLLGALGALVATRRVSV